MIKKLNCWFIANLGWLTVAVIIAVGVLVRLVFIPTPAERVVHAGMITTQDYIIRQPILRLLFTFLSFCIAIITARYTYENYEAVIAQRLFKSKGKVISASPAGYTFNRFLMASVLTVLISATILAFI